MSKNPNLGLDQIDVQVDQIADCCDPSAFTCTSFRLTGDGGSFEFTVCSSSYDNSGQCAHGVEQLQGPTATSTSGKWSLSLVHDAAMVCAPDAVRNSCEGLLMGQDSLSGNVAMDDSEPVDVHFDRDEIEFGEPVKLD